jgi:DNA-binding transcriptional ArsR family regulator
MNWRNEYNRMVSESKIIETIYDDEWFEFMTFGELLEKTGLSKPTLRHHLKELCQEREREGQMNLEVYEALNKLESGEMAKGDIHEILKHPTLITKHGVYKLHPTTKEAMDNGIYPYLVKDDDKDKLFRLMKRRQRGDEVKVSLEIRKASLEEIRKARQDRLQRLKNEVSRLEDEIDELNHK